MYKGVRGEGEEGGSDPNSSRLLPRILTSMRGREAGKRGIDYPGRVSVLPAVF